MRPKRTFKQAAVSAGILFVICVALVLWLGHLANNLPDTSSEPDPDQVQQAEADKAAAEKRAQEAREQLAEDKTEAAKSGIPVKAYSAARAQVETAYSDCTLELKNEARFDVKTDWGTNYTWNTDGATITIFGSDMHLQNGFGAYSARYICIWSVKTKTVISVDTD